MFTLPDIHIYNSPSYPFRKYDEDLEGRMTTHRDTLLQRNEDNNIKDQLLREGQQEPEDSIE